MFFKTSLFSVLTSFFLSTQTFAMFQPREENVNLLPASSKKNSIKGGAEKSASQSSSPSARNCDFEDKKQFEEKIAYFAMNRSTPSHYERYEFHELLRNLGVSLDAEISPRGNEKDLIRKTLINIDTLMTYANSPDKRSYNKNYFTLIRHSLLELIYNFIYYRVHEATNFLDTLDHREDTYFKKATQDQKNRISSFLERHDIKNALQSVLNFCPSLTKKGKDFLFNYASPQCGAFINLDIPLTPIGKSPYLHLFLDLIPQLLLIDDWSSFSHGLRIAKSGIHTLQNRELIIRLARVHQTIVDVSQVPLTHLSSENVQKYAQQNLYFLGTTIPKWIPYDFHKVTKEKYAQAEICRKSSLPDKVIEGQTTILHSRIPWNDLLSIGNMLHSNNHETEPTHLRIFYSALPEIVAECKHLRTLTLNLIKNYKGLTVEISPYPPSFPHIQYLAAYNKDKGYVKKLIPYLESFSPQNIQNTPQFDLEGRMIQYAALRTLAVLGETSKEIVAISSDKNLTLWKNIEDIRDTLAHPENYLLAHQRLRELLEDSKSFLTAIHSHDFKELLIRVRSVYTSLQGLNTWVKIKTFYHVFSSPLFEESQNISNFVHYLKSRLGSEEKNQLKDTFEQRRKLTIGEILDLEKEATDCLDGKFRRPLRELRTDIDQLPLPENKKKILKETGNFHKDLQEKREKGVLCIQELFLSFDTNESLPNLERFFIDSSALSPSEKIEQYIEKLPLLTEDKRILREAFKKINKNPLKDKQKEKLKAILEKLSSHEMHADLTQIFEEDSKVLSKYHLHFEENVKVLPLHENEKKALKALYIQIKSEELSLKEQESVRAVLQRALDNFHHILKVKDELLGTTLNTQFEKDNIESSLEALPIENSSKKLLKSAFMLLDSDSLKTNKKQEVHTIFDEIKSYTILDFARSTAEDLIEILSDPTKHLLPQKELTSKLDHLGVENQTLWITFYQRIISSSESSSANTSQADLPNSSPHINKGVRLDSPNDYTKSLFRIKGSAKSLLRTLQELRKITENYRDHQKDGALDKYANNNLIHYACEHLTSCLRSHASILEESLKLIKIYKNPHPAVVNINQMYDRIENNLNYIIQKGKDTFHLHDVTEFENMTEYGRRYLMFSQVIEFLDGFPLSRASKNEAILRLPSFFEELQTLLIFTQEELCGSVH